jgi:hypothetical protein
MLGLYNPHSADKWEVIKHYYSAYGFTGFLKKTPTMLKEFASSEKNHCKSVFSNESEGSSLPKQYANIDTVNYKINSIGEIKVDRSFLEKLKILG